MKRTVLVLASMGLLLAVQTSAQPRQQSGQPADQVVPGGTLSEVQQLRVDLQVARDELQAARQEILAVKLQLDEYARRWRGFEAEAQQDARAPHGEEAKSVRVDTERKAMYVGKLAGENNAGAYGTALGYSALRYNTRNFSNAVGAYALAFNTGDESNAHGYQALEYNTADYCNAMGHDALRWNTGVRSNAFGGDAGWYNTGDDFTAIGNSAGQLNVGANVTAIGSNAGFANEGDDSVFVGSQTGVTFNDDAVSAKTFDGAAVKGQQITIAGHGFGAANTYRLVRFTQGTDTITGLTDNVLYQVKIIDANTVRVNNQHELSTPLGTGHTFTPQTRYSNVILIGKGLDATKSNQIILGPSSITETVLRGTVVRADGATMDHSNAAGSGVAGRFASRQVALENGESASLEVGGALTANGLLLVVSSEGLSAIYCVGGGSTIEISDPLGAFTPAEDGAGTTNIYYNTDRYRIQNNRGGVVTYQVFYFLAV
jgi:hypothetical protein